MPNSHSSTPRKRPSWRLVVLSIVVVLAHWAVLRQAPLAWAAHASSDTGSAWAFSTRTLVAPEAPEALVPVPAKEPTPSPMRKLRSVPPVADTQAVSGEGIVSDPPVAPEEYTHTAIQSIADTPPAENPDAGSPVLLAAATLPSTQSPEAGGRTATKAAATLPPAKAVQRFVVPPSARLRYDVKGEVKGFPYHVNGDLQWAHDGKTYSARIEISHFLLGSRIQTSTGQLGAHGLEPLRFGDKVRSEVAAHFNYERNKVTFSANTPDVPLLPGAQDQLSVLIQAATMVAGDPRQFSPGSTLSFQAVGPRSAEHWVFTVGVFEKLTLPGGEVSALHLWRDPNGEYDSRLEVWLAPELSYLPARMRLSQANGDVVDQLWKK